MPELPDVEIYRRRIDDHAKDRTIKKISPAGSQVLKVSKKKISGLKDQKITSTRREGKYCLVETGDNKWLVLHFGMTGAVETYEKSDNPPEYSVLSIEFSNQDKNLAVTSKRKLGRITLTGSPDQFRQEHDLGKDALDSSEKEFLDAMKKKKGGIKSALMDQSTIAGIGNIYSDEILFQSKIHPGEKVSNLKDEKIKELHRIMKKVLKKAISSDADPEKLPEGYLIPHRRKGENCPACDSHVKSKKISGRRSWFCPDCQEKYS